MLKETWMFNDSPGNGQWSNNACEGYCIMAMQEAGFTDEDIHLVLNQFSRVFDFNSVSYAAAFRIDYAGRQV